MPIHFNACTADGGDLGPSGSDADSGGRRKLIVPVESRFRGILRWLKSVQRPAIEPRRGGKIIAPGKRVEASSARGQGAKRRFRALDAIALTPNAERQFNASRRGGVAVQ